MKPVINTNLEMFGEQAIPVACRRCGIEDNITFDIAELLTMGQDKYEQEITKVWDACNCTFGRDYTREIWEQMEGELRAQAKRDAINSLENDYDPELPEDFHLEEDYFYVIDLLSDMDFDYHHNQLNHINMFNEWLEITGDLEQESSNPHPISFLKERAYHNLDRTYVETYNQTVDKWLKGEIKNEKD